MLENLITEGSQWAFSQAPIVVLSLLFIAILCFAIWWLFNRICSSLDKLTEAIILLDSNQRANTQLISERFNSLQNIIQLSDNWTKDTIKELVATSNHLLSVLIDNRNALISLSGKIDELRFLREEKNCTKSTNKSTT